MSAEVRPTFLARLARRPFPIFLGVAAGLLGCSVAGRLAARQQPYKHFVRFHQGLSPEAHYYPTYSQTLNLARQHVAPGKVLVLVGGNSTLNGACQRHTHVWALRLQELLGEDYVVLNLAVRAGLANEVGALIAERLAGEGVPVVFVCNGLVWGPDGDRYRYFFWDAWGKGQLPPDARRDRWLAEEFPAPHADREQAREARRRGLVDGLAYAQDLWTYVAYRHRATSWTSLKYPEFWRPYRRMPDSERGVDAVPFAVRRSPEREAGAMASVRRELNGPFGKMLAAADYDRVGEMYKNAIPAALHDRTLFLVTPQAPDYRTKLSPQEQADYREYCGRFAEALRRAGFETELVGLDFQPEDYFDNTHFSEQGGRKLAEALAPAVRAVSGRLYGPRSAAAQGGKP